MARRKARTPAQLEKIFNHFIAETTANFGRAPCVSLDEDDEGEAVLTAVTIVGKTSILQGYGKIIRCGDECISARVPKEEIPTIIELLRAYPQPGPDFDPNIDYWMPIDPVVCSTPAHLAVCDTPTGLDAQTKLARWC